MQEKETACQAAQGVRESGQRSIEVVPQSEAQKSEIEKPS